MAKPKKMEAPERTTEQNPKDRAFTGKARSFECYVHEGFKNYRIVTLDIQDGLVIEKTYSDPYASFEANARLELFNTNDFVKLMTKYRAGKNMGEE